MVRSIDDFADISPLKKSQVNHKPESLLSVKYFVDIKKAFRLIKSDDQVMAVYT